MIIVSLLVMISLLGMQAEMVIKVQAGGGVAEKELDKLKKEGQLVVRQEEEAAQV